MNDDPAGQASPKLHKDHPQELCGRLLAAEAACVSVTGASFTKMLNCICLPLNRKTRLMTSPNEFTKMLTQVHKGKPNSDVTILCFGLTFFLTLAGLC